MNIRQIFTVAIFSLFLLVSMTNRAVEYQSDQAKVLIDDMVKAHGGYQKWLNTPSFQFTAIMYLAALKLEDGRTAFDNWRYYTVTIDPKTSRTYVDIMFEPNSGPELGYDGDQIWMAPYSLDIPKFRDGPVQLMWFHYGMVTLPFMTQVDGVKHQYIGNKTLPDDPTQYEVVQMSFEPKGKVHAGSFDLYIDPKTSRLKAWIQGAMLPLLPGNALPKEFRAGGRNMLRIIDEYQQVDGFIIARSYASFSKKNNDVTGAHIIVNPSFSTDFDLNALKRPKGAKSYPFGPSNN